MAMKILRLTTSPRGEAFRGRLDIVVRGVRAGVARLTPLKEPRIALAVSQAFPDRPRHFETLRRELRACMRRAGVTGSCRPSIVKCRSEQTPIGLQKEGRSGTN